jgi:hypothetical protein
LGAELGQAVGGVKITLEGLRAALEDTLHPTLTPDSKVNINVGMKLQRKKEPKKKKRERDLNY